ncbi:MAG: NAD(P)-dependent oxidoreductase [Hyphomicrobium sp.]
MARIAWIGLGVMGFHMARHLKERGGHDVVVYNRSPKKITAWNEKFPQSQTARSPAEAAKGANFVFACVGNDNDLREITIGTEGAFQSMPSEAIFVDHTTTSATVSRELHQRGREQNLFFIDAPVSGGQVGAEKGQLAIMAGGDVDAFSRVLPYLECYSKIARLIGPSGSGQLTKMVNQIAIAGLLQGLSEAIHFAEGCKLNLAQVIEVISKGAAQSWQMDNRWKTMHERQFNFGFAVDWMLKDLKICLEEASHCGAQLPIATLVRQYYVDIQASGGGSYDTSSLILNLVHKTI